MLHSLSLQFYLPMFVLHVEHPIFTVIKRRVTRRMSEVLLNGLCLLIDPHSRFSIFVF